MPPHSPRRRPLALAARRRRRAGADGHHLRLSPTGNDRALNCGGACSAKLTQFTTVTLTAIPPTGKSFVSWGGACSGTSTTCTVFINQNLSVQANFSK